MSDNEPQPTLFGPDVYTQTDWLLWLKAEPRRISQMPPEASALYHEILEWAISHLLDEGYESPFFVDRGDNIMIRDSFRWPPKKTCPTCGGPLRC